MENLPPRWRNFLKNLVWYIATLVILAISLRFLSWYGLLLLWGVGLGWGVSMAIPSFAPVPTEVPMTLVGLGLVVAVVTGLVAGFVPAHRAARMSRVEALRHE